MIVDIPITEHDVECFQELIYSGEPFTWTFDSVEIHFFSREHKKEELENQITGLKQSMEVAGYGSKDTRLLQSLYNQLGDLE